MPFLMSEFQDIESRILYEDNHLLVFNKRPSEIVQGDKTGDEPLSEILKRYLKEKYRKPGNVFMGVVHRLDRPVSGIVLFAKTSKALTRLNEKLREGTIHKTYWAVVKNKPAENSGHLIHYLRRNEEKNKTYVYTDEKKGSLRAELVYRIIGSSDTYHLLEVNLLTGRHHQIRAQLAYIGCPVKGDLKYGYPRSNDDGSIHLHSYKVDFVHPVRKESMTFSAEPPTSDALWKFFSRQSAVGK